MDASVGNAAKNVQVSSSSQLWQGIGTCHACSAIGQLDMMAYMYMLPALSEVLSDSR